MIEKEQKIYWAAFDVASEKLDVAAGDQWHSKPQWSAPNVPNKERNLKNCLEMAKKKADEAGQTLRLVCESTGVYHRELERCAAEMNIPMFTTSPNAKGSKKRRTRQTLRSSGVMRCFILHV